MSDAEVVAAGMRSIVSQQLGRLEVPENQLLDFPNGLLGFPHAKSFCLVEVRPGSRFQLLQSVERADLAFVVANPLIVDAEYPLDLARAVALPLLEGDEGIGVACIVTVPTPPGVKTINLVAPLVMGVQSRRGGQVILPANYEVRHELV